MQSVDLCWCVQVFQYYCCRLTFYLKKNPILCRNGSPNHQPEPQVVQVLDVSPLLWICCPAASWFINICKNSQYTLIRHAFKLLQKNVYTEFFFLVFSSFQNLLPTATPQDAQQWLLRNRFSPFSRLFTNFSGIVCSLFTPSIELYILLWLVDS